MAGAGGGRGACVGGERRARARESPGRELGVRVLACSRPGGGARGGGRGRGPPRRSRGRGRGGASGGGRGRCRQGAGPIRTAGPREGATAAPGALSDPTVPVRRTRLAPAALGTPRACTVPSRTSRGRPSLCPPCAPPPRSHLSPAPEVSPAPKSSGRGWGGGRGRGALLSGGLQGARPREGWFRPSPRGPPSVSGGRGRSGIREVSAQKAERNSVASPPPALPAPSPRSLLIQTSARRVVSAQSRPPPSEEMAEEPEPQVKGARPARAGPQGAPRRAALGSPRSLSRPPPDDRPARPRCPLSLVL